MAQLPRVESRERAEGDVSVRKLPGDIAMPGNDISIRFQVRALANADNFRPTHVESPARTASSNSVEHQFATILFVTLRCMLFC